MWGLRLGDGEESTFYGEGLMGLFFSIISEIDQDEAEPSSHPRVRLLLLLHQASREQM